MCPLNKRQRPGDTEPLNESIGIQNVWSFDSGDVLFVSRAQSRLFRNPVEVLEAQTVEDVLPAMRRIEDAVEDGLHAAGFVAYEAAPAFDPALSVHSAPGKPLLWFGLYATQGTYHDCPEAAGSYSLEIWEPLVSQSEYCHSIGRIREWIAAGDTYQVNYTFPMHSRFLGDPAGWFSDLCRAQHADHCALVHTGRFVVLSASPELFFRLADERITMKPMKGTRPRGLFPAQDREAARNLVESEKDRAENIMIVDLIRNDLGRICIPGSVVVDDLFRAERYETVWQMTSTVSGKTRARMTEVFSALFPSGSVTGAPKVRTMQIIHEVEPLPRGVYCGSVGYWLPGQTAEFNVAIRTAVLNTQTSEVVYHVGGGVTWDSTSEGEYAECMVKAAVLSHARPPFELLESLLWEGEYFLLDLHLDRIEASAEYFGFTFSRDAVRELLQETASSLAARSTPAKVRVLLAHDGRLRVDVVAVSPALHVRLGFARAPVNQGDVFLYHKTTFRNVYDSARASRPDCDDVLLWNSRGEVTESTTANLVAELNGQLMTPPVECGLLAGTLRAHLLGSGEIVERVLTRQDILSASRLYLINSVRKWIDVTLVDSE